MFQTTARAMLLTALTACLTAPAAEPDPEPMWPRITPDNLKKLRALPTLDREAWRIVSRPDGKQIAFVRWQKPAEVLDALMPQYVASRIFYALLEAAASELASRRRAMKAAMRFSPRALADAGVG